MKPLLSILICSIPSRLDRVTKLYNDILAMVGDKNIEVLMFTDNKKRTIGEKREAIKNISNGKYFMFVDDDDSLFSVDEIYEACKNDVDVITFKNRSLNADGSSFIVTFGLGHDVEHNTEEGRYLDCNRPPFPQCAWNEKFRQIIFPPVSYGEDWEWTRHAVLLAQTETHIPLILHGYNFDPMITEADTSTNEHWKNPNHEEIKRCVVNLATVQFIRGQQRLKQAMLSQLPDFIHFTAESQVGAPPHSDNPYAFKIYAIERARELGYNQILWLDSSVYPVKDITPVFDWLTEKGIFLEEAGHYVGQWCNDEALEYFGITREEGMKMPMFSAGFVGLDFRNPISVDFFAAWKESMLNGMFRGSWSNHRHDLTCGSAIANISGLVPLYSKGGNFFAYVGQGYEMPRDTVVFHLQGI